MKIQMKNLILLKKNLKKNIQIIIKSSWKNTLMKLQKLRQKAVILRKV